MVWIGFVPEVFILSAARTAISTLEALGTVELVNEPPVRGAIEHFYVSRVLEDHLVQTMLDATKQEDEAV